MFALSRSILIVALTSPLPALAHAGSNADASDGNVVMVELFTSQGCASCPPADEHLAELARRDDVLALSLHVDYWDYLGWRDTYADPIHRIRQAEYRDKLGSRVLFTPQMIINGRQSLPGTRHELIENAIEEEAQLPAAAAIQLDQEDGMLHVEITRLEEPGPCMIWVAAFDREATVEIKRGENAGRVFTYRNVVGKLMKLGPWNGRDQARLPLPQPAKGEGIAVWLQEEASGRIIAASFIER